MDFNKVQERLTKIDYSNLIATFVEFNACHLKLFLKTDYISPNPKQPFSQAEDGEQFCCRGGDCFHRFSGIVAFE